MLPTDVSVNPFPAERATLMTAELKDTLVDHNAGNYRLLMIKGCRDHRGVSISRSWGSIVTPVLTMYTLSK